MGVERNFFPYCFSNFVTNGQKSNTPAPVTVPIIMGLAVMPPATLPIMTKPADTILGARLTFL